MHTVAPELCKVRAHTQLAELKATPRHIRHPQKAAAKSEHIQIKKYDISESVYEKVEGGGKI